MSTPPRPPISMSQIQVWGQPVMALSVWQPWASAITWGEKACETRSWMTTYRGLILIHAAQHRSAETRDLCAEAPEIASALAQRGVSYDELPRGAFVALARLKAVTAIRDGRSVHLSTKEVAWGDWSLGRYAWWLTDAVAIDPPIRAKGQQGLWRVPKDVVRQLAGVGERA